jgi:hypothetical protein
MFVLPTNPHWVRMVGYGPFFLCLIHKEGLCPSSGDINRLMMMMTRNCDAMTHRKNVLASTLVYKCSASRIRIVLMCQSQYSLFSLGMFPHT